METNFTKGAWKIYKTDVYLNNGYVCVESEKNVIHEMKTYSTTERESIANANLISAAPDLFEALLLARKCVGSQLVDLEGDGNNFITIKEVIDSAIDKALGVNQDDQ